MEENYPLLLVVPLLVSPGKCQMSASLLERCMQRSSGRFSNIHLPFWLESLFNVELSPEMVSATLLFSSAWPLSLTVIHMVLLAKSILSHKATPLKTSCLYCCFGFAWFELWNVNYVFINRSSTASILETSYLDVIFPLSQEGFLGVVSQIQSLVYKGKCFFHESFYWLIYIYIYVIFSLQQIFLIGQMITVLYT